MLNLLYNFSRRGEKHNKFTIQLRTTTSDGLLIWMNQGATLQGDYLAVAINNGQAELSFNLGKKQPPIKILTKVMNDINDAILMARFCRRCCCTNIGMHAYGFLFHLFRQSDI